MDEQKTKLQRDAADSRKPDNDRAEQIARVLGCLQSSGGRCEWVRDDAAGWIVGGQRLVVIESADGIDVLASISPEHKGTPALVAQIRRLGFAGSKSIQAHAADVVAAFDAIEWDRVSSWAGAWIDAGHGPKLQAAIHGLVALLGTNGGLRAACLPPEGEQLEVITPDPEALPPELEALARRMGHAPKPGAES